MINCGYLRYDETVQNAAELLSGRELRWRKVPEEERMDVPEGITWYYAERRLYVVRDRRGPVELFAFIVAGRPGEAVRAYLGEAADGTAAAKLVGKESEVKG